MAERSRFFDSVGGDRIYTSQAWADIFELFVRDGYVLGNGDMLEVVDTSPQSMGISVGIGAGWVQGRSYENTSVKIIAISGNADPVETRYDRVVIRLDYNERVITVEVKEGVVGAGAPPALQRDANRWELGLATIEVPAGAALITQAQIEDTRNDPDVCGVAVGRGTQSEMMTTAQRDALVGDELFVGCTIFNIDAMLQQVYVGVGGWQSIGTPVAQVDVFTSSDTWTKPAGARHHELFAWGGGGGGGYGTGSHGGGGGSRAYAHLPSSMIADALTITIGAGGSGGTNSSAGGTGGTTTIGGVLRAFGGGGANASSTRGAGAGQLSSASGNTPGSPDGGIPGSSGTPGGDSVHGGGAGGSGGVTGYAGGNSAYGGGGGGGGSYNGGPSGPGGSSGFGFIAGGTTSVDDVGKPGTNGSGVFGGGGGSGGGGNSSNRVGGAGGARGGGGGGGYGTGQGGAGGRGEVVIVTYFS